MEIYIYIIRGWLASYHKIYLFTYLFIIPQYCEYVTLQLICKIVDEL